MHPTSPTTSQVLESSGDNSLTETQLPVHVPTAQLNLLDDGLHPSKNLLAPQLILIDRSNTGDKTAILLKTDGLVASLTLSNTDNHSDARCESIEQEQEHAGQGDEATDVPLQDPEVRGPAQSHQGRPAEQLEWSSTHDSAKAEPYLVSNDGPVDDQNEQEDGCLRD
ncbi:hypothetical protein BG000_001107 [Podila horticola]|nr:hypothetical protein BG000_001107 [Podila horticola]